MTHFDWRNRQNAARNCLSCWHWNNSNKEFGDACKNRPMVNPNVVCVWWEPTGGANEAKTPEE